MHPDYFRGDVGQKSLASQLQDLCGSTSQENVAVMQKKTTTSSFDCGGRSGNDLPISLDDRGTFTNR